MDQLRDCLQVVSRALGDSVLGAYRFGSAVAGGLRPASDLDVLVVTRQPLRARERCALVDGLLRVSGHRTGRRPLEVTVVVQGDVRPWRYPPTADLVFGEWLLEEIEGDGPPARQPCPDLAIGITQVRQSGVALLGPSPEDLLDPVPPEDVVRAATDGIPALVAYLDADARNVALTLARVWVTVETGRIVPKDEAAAWSLGRLPEDLRPVMAHARSLYLTSPYAGETWPRGSRAQVRPLVEHIIDRVSRSPGTAGRRSVGPGDR